MKFHITRVDGKPIDEKAKYFALRLDDPTTDDYEAAQTAMSVYASLAPESNAKAALEFLSVGAMNLEEAFSTPKTDAVTGHCVCSATHERDVVPRSLAVALEAENAMLRKQLVARGYEPKTEEQDGA